MAAEVTSLRLEGRFRPVRGGERDTHKRVARGSINTRVFKCVRRDRVVVGVVARAGGVSGAAKTPSERIGRCGGRDAKAKKAPIEAWDREMEKSDSSSMSMRLAGMTLFDVFDCILDSGGFTPRVIFEERRPTDRPTHPPLSRRTPLSRVTLAALHSSHSYLAHILQFARYAAVT